MINKFDTFNKLNEGKDSTPKAKYKKGDTVYMDIDKKPIKFTVQGGFWKDEDELSKSFGVKYKPTWFYHLDKNFGAEEGQLRDEK